MKTMLLRFNLLVVVALALPGFAHAQQSELQHCLSLPSNAAAAVIEYCQGMRASVGYGMPQNRALAFQHYLKAAEMGYADAQAVVGAAYRQGWQVAPNMKLAAQWYARAAAQGSANAELDLGLMYSTGMGVPKDLSKAHQLIQAAASQGNLQARQDLARLSDDGLKADAGLALYNQAVARYRTGDHTGAAVLILKAAQAGNSTATYEMGYLYENGDGVPADSVRSAQWYLKAAAMGNASGEAAAGQLYELGRGVPDNWVEAAKWYLKSAQQGNKMGESRLGRAYEYGIGVPLNLTEAASWYDKAAAQGDGQAAYFAQYIRNNHGFDGSSENPQEQAIMAPYRSQPWALRMPPTGRVFRNTADRLRYFQGWANAAAAYESCMSRHVNAVPGTTYRCPAPVPPR